MKVPFSLKVADLYLVVFAAILLLTVTSNAQVTRQVNSSGTTHPVATPTGVPGIQDPEFDEGLEGNDSDDDLGVDLQGNLSGKTAMNRSIAAGPGPGQPAVGKNKAKSNPEVTTSFNGLNFFNQRFANNGNQFSVVPPDQALCAGN